MRPPWIYDTKRHPEAAVFIVRHRSCAESFTHGLAWVSSLSTALFAGVAVYFGLNASVYTDALAGLCGALFVAVSLAGEWALANNKAFLSYLYMATLYGLVIAIIWAAAMCKSDIDQGVQFIDEAWYVLQTKTALPFTTQLDQKVQFTVSIHSQHILSLGVWMAHRSCPVLCACHPRYLL